LEWLEARVPLHAAAVITEMMYQPLPGSDAELSQLPGAVATDFEYIEVQNVHPFQPLDLAELQLAGDIQFTFPSQLLDPGQRVVVAANPAAFAARYGSLAPALGPWQGQLADSSLNVTLIDDDGHTVADMNLVNSTQWPFRAAGLGSSLELISPATTLPSQMSKPDRWQASFAYHGTPGAENSTGLGIVINEVFAGLQSTSGAIDQVELWNPTATAIDIGGWYLGNSPTNPLQYALPANTILAPGAFQVFNANQFNPTPQTPGPGDFQLDAVHGDQLLLSVPDGNASIQRLESGLRFGPSGGRSWGREPAQDLAIPLSAPTFGAENAGPAVGPVLITEVNYHPDAPSAAAMNLDPALTSDGLEYIELYNPTLSTRNLSQWSIGGDIAFTFANATTLAPGKALVVVSFDPQLSSSAFRLQAFREHYGISSSVQLVGPFQSNLSDDYGRVTLLEPGVPPPGEPGFVPQLRRDTVRFDDVAPWPASPDGNGQSLNRANVGAAGLTAAGWMARNPTPGLVNFTALPQPKLPDLTIWDDPLLGLNYFSNLDVHPYNGRQIMRFSTAVQNTGQGPLTVRGGGVVANNQQVLQVVQNLDGTTTEYAAGEYLFHPTHGHVHVANYALYRLYEIAPDGELGNQVAGGEKVSFCLLDSAPFDRQLPAAPELPIYAACERSTQGISVGWADLYAADLDDQWIDVEDLPPGEYWFETVVDPFNNLFESDETNNVIRHKVVLGVAEYNPDFIDAAGQNELRLGTGDKQLSQLSIHKPGDVDTFSWVAPTDGTLDVDVSLIRAQGDVDLYVWGTNSQGAVELVSSTTEGDNEHVTMTVTGGKNYFLVVKDLSGDTNPAYELSVDGPDIVPDLFEPNNSVLEPTFLGQTNRTLKDLSVHSATDRDFFTWTSPETATLLLDLQFNSAQGNLDLFVHDFATQQIYSSQLNIGRELLEVPVDQGRTYVIIVEGRDGDMVSRYDLTLDVLNIPLDNYEPNDTYAEPANLGAGDRDLDNLTVHKPFNRDFYRWQAPSDGQAVADLLFAQSAGDLDLVLWHNGESVASSIGRADNEQLAFAVEGGHSYVLEIAGKNGAINPQYRLTIDGPEPTADGYEPNDSLASATNLGEGDVDLAMANVHEPFDSDFYLWTPAASGVAIIDLLFLQVEGDLDLALWADGIEIAVANSSADNERLFLHLETTHTYALEVRGKDGDVNPHYELRIDGPELAGDSYEPNDSRATAADLGIGDVQLTGLNIHQRENHDFFRWVPVATGRAVIDLLFLHNTGDLDLSFWVEGVEVMISESIDDNEQLRVDVIQGQEYVIEVRGKPGAVNPFYELQIDGPDTTGDAYEPNDSIGTPADLGGSDIQLTGLSVHETLNSDFYSWTPRATGTAAVDLTFLHAEGDLDLAVWVEGQRLLLSASDDDDEGLTLGVIEGQTIIVEVLGKNGATNFEYSLAIDGPAPAQVTSLQIGKSSVPDRLYSVIGSDGSPHTVPWMDWQSIQIGFSENVVVRATDLQVTGVAVAQYPLSNFSYDSALHTATWTLVTVPAQDELTLTLSDVVTDAAHNRLDGEAGNPLLPSGDGQPGGNFSVSLRVAPGDFHHDNALDARDIDAVAAAMRNDDPLADLDGDGQSTTGDILALVRDIMGSTIGDVNLDGLFNSSDLVIMFAVGQFEDTLAGNSSWVSGDLNGDLEFNSSDLVFAFQIGGYQV
jgi:hypothetical protein